MNNNRFLYFYGKDQVGSYNNFPEALPSSEKIPETEKPAESFSKSDLESNLQKLGIEVAAELLKQGKLEVPPSIENYFELRNDFLSKIDLFTTDLETEKAYEGLKLYYKEFESLLPLNINILDEDIRETLEIIKERMASIKAMKIEDEIKEAIEPYKKYITFDKDPVYGFKIKITSLFVELTKKNEKDLSKREKQIIEKIQKLILDLSNKISLNREKAFNDVESKEYMKDFYRANIHMSNGKYIEAKKLYKKFIKLGWKAQRAKGKQEEFMGSPEYLRAKECLKHIGLLECDFAEKRLQLLERSVKNTPVGWTYGMAEEKFGVSKRDAINILESQNIVLSLARGIIEADNRILTLESAIKRIGSFKYVNLEAKLKELGLSGKINEVKDSYGAWDKRGIAFFNSRFAKKGLLHLDAIRSIIDEQGKLDKSSLKARAEYYKELELYEAAEATYDLYFRDLYKKYEKNIGGGRKIFFETYAKTHMVDLARKVDDIVKNIEKDGETIVSNREKDVIKQKLIERAWKEALRKKITAECKAKVGKEWNNEMIQRAGFPFPDYEKPVSKISERNIQMEWLDYNNDILQVDRKWYEIWKFTCREWDKFLSTVAVDLFFILASAGGAHLAGKAAAKSVSKSLLTKEFTKLGVVEAFRAGGWRSATRVLMSKLGSKTINKLGLKLGTKRIEQLSKLLGFGAESLAFSELLNISSLLRTGDLSSMISLEKHLENWGHSVLTLGTIKGVGIATKGINIPKGARGITNVTLDTALLTGIGVGTSEISGKKLTDNEITEMLRHNVILSVGIRGFQVLKNWAVNRKPSLNRLLEARLSIEERLNNISGAFVDAKAEVQRLNKELAKTSKTLARLRKIKGEKPSEMRSRINNLQIRKNNLKNELNQKNPNYERLKKDVTELEEQINQLDKAIEHIPPEGFKVPSKLIRLMPDSVKKYLYKHYNVEGKYLGPEGFMKLILSPNAQEFHTAIKILENAKRSILSPTQMLYITSELPLSRQTTFLSRISKFMTPSIRKSFASEAKKIGISDIPKGFMPEVKLPSRRLDMYRQHLIGLIFTSQLTFAAVEAFQGRAVERPGIERVEARVEDFKGDGPLVVKESDFNKMPKASNRSGSIIVKLDEIKLSPEKPNIREFDHQKTRELFSRDQSEIINVLEKAGIDKSISSNLKLLFDNLIPELKPYFRVFAAIDKEGNQNPYLVVDQDGINSVMGGLIEDTPYKTIESLKELNLSAHKGIEQFEYSKADFFILNTILYVITSLPGFIVNHPDVATILALLIYLKSKRSRRWINKRFSNWRERRKESKESKEVEETIEALPNINEILEELVSDPEEAINNLKEMRPELRRFIRIARDKFDSLDFIDRKEARNLFIALIKNKYIRLRTSLIKKAFNEGRGNEALERELNDLINKNDTVLREIVDNELDIFPENKKTMSVFSKLIKRELVDNLRKEGWKDADIDSAKTIIDDYINFLQLYEPGNSIRQIRLLKIKLDFWKRKYEISKDIEEPAENASVIEKTNYAEAQKFINFYKDLKSKYNDAINDKNIRQKLMDGIDKKLPKNPTRRKILLKSLKYALSGGLVYLGYKWLGEEESAGEPEPDSPEELERSLEKEREQEAIDESRRAADDLIL